MRDRIEHVQLLLRRLKTSIHHSGSDEGISAWKLIWNGLPYYLNRGGYARDPLTMFFTINGKCNLHCRMCDVGQQNKESMFYKNLKGAASQDFPYERFKSLIDEVRTFKPYIGITTTEPLLYPHIFDAVEYAGSRGMKVNITTNGTLVEKYLNEILDCGLHRISISIDGPAHVHDKMRGVPGTYEKVIKGINLLKEEKKRRGTLLPHVYIGSFICDTNYAHIVELIENLPLDIVERLNMKLMVFTTKEIVDGHNLVWGHKYPATVSCMPDDFRPENIDVDVLHRQLEEVKRRFGHFSNLYFKTDGAMLEKYFYRSREFLDVTRCILPWFVSQITASGDLIILTRCYNINLGNIMDKPFSEVWNGPKIREFRRDLQKHGRFPGCVRCEGMMSH